MISRLIGALARAFLVVLLVATPSLLLPATSADTAQIVALVSIFAAALTFFEYSAAYPTLVEFRDAPPFNRMRFISLALTVFFLALICRGVEQPTPLTFFMQAIGALVGHVMDFPYSPVRLMVLLLPEDADMAHLKLVRMAAGMSYFISLASVLISLLLLRMRAWPSRAGAFNVWVNLPTFDPTAGGDVVRRLRRDAHINVALGFLLPFLVPAVLASATNLFGSVQLSGYHTLIWTMTAWAFLPASLFMRGVAMGRIADMIEGKRRKAYAASELEHIQQPA